MEKEIRQDIIIGSRCFSNYFWSIFLLIGGSGFLLAGFSSYFHKDFLPFANSTNLVFIPQGLIMLFYGTLSVSFSLYIFITIVLDIGSGYNEYNRLENLVKVVRKGFPGKNRHILLTYSFTNIKSIGIKITEGLNSTRTIYLCLKDERNIPLTQAQELISISDLESTATDLAKFLDLKLENL
jgi:hypothetical protein